MLSIAFDGAQARLKSDMLSLLASGRDWLAQSTTELAFDAPAVWIEPVLGTAMLMPAPLNPAWTKRSDGSYTKYRLADLTGLTDAGGWKEVVLDGGGPFVQYFAAGGNPGVLAGKTPPQPANQPIIMEWYQPHFTFEGSVVMECGWSDGGSGAAGVSLRVTAGGRVEVWKDAAIQGVYSLSSRVAGAGHENRQASGPASGFVGLILLPFRDRELLVYSTAGGAFSHVFTDLAEGEADQTITDAARFWFSVPAPHVPALRLAPVKFATVGTLRSRPVAWRSAPPDGDPQFDLHQALTQAAHPWLSPSVETAAENPAGLADPKQIQVEFSGGPDATPFLYGVRAWHAAQTADTAEPAGGPVDGGSALLGCSLSVADTPGGMQARLILDPSQTVANLRSRMGRTVSLADSAGTFLEGIAEAPLWSDGFSVETEAVDLVVRDAWKAVEEYVFADPIPLDGMTLTQAYTLIAEAAGCIAHVSSEGDSIRIGSAGAAREGEWECLVRLGDRASAWLARLHDSYAADWHHGVGRDGRLTLLAPDDLPAEPAATLFRSIEDALAGGVAAEDAWRFVYRSAHRTLLEPEANEVWVLGQDLRTRLPILVAKRDGASADPTLAEDARPDNWLGRIRKSVYADPGLSSKEACLATLDRLFPRASARRVLIDVSCEFLDGLWKGDLVRLAGAGEDGADIVGRIKAFEGLFQRTEAGGSWRPFLYVLEVGGLVAPLGDYGATGPTIRAHRRRRLLAKMDEPEPFAGAMKGSPQFAAFVLT